MENSLEEQYRKRRHHALWAGRAYLLLAGLKMSQEDFLDIMHDYVMWLELCDAQKEHNDDPDKTEHLNEWIEKSKDISMKKYTRQKRIIHFLTKQLNNLNKSTVVFNHLFGEGNWNA